VKKATIEDIKIGAKLTMFISEDNSNNLHIEVRAIVDKDHVVYRVFSDQKERLVYVIDFLIAFESWIKDGWLYTGHNDLQELK
jgi:hypothetical protein